MADDKKAFEAQVDVPKVDPQIAIRKQQEAEEALRDSLTSLQILLTDITEGLKPRSGINHVITRYPDDHWAEEHRENIPKIDEMYQWDPDVLESLWLGYQMNENVLLVGPPGSGKTKATQQFAAWLRQPFARFNGKDSIEASAFLGYTWATKEGMEWRDGLMPQAVASGYLTAIDEIFKLPPGIQMALQSLYEKDGFLMLDEKPGTIKDKHIHPRMEFRIVGTDNTKGTGDGIDQYAAGQQQDISSLDRFGITQNVSYMKQAREVHMLEKRYPLVDKVAIKKSVTFANLVREAFMNQGDLSLTMSPRGLMVVCGLLENKVSLETALELSYVNKLGDQGEIRVAKKFISNAI
jgi:MoxR-like ATPase